MDALIVFVEKIKNYAYYNPDLAASICCLFAPLKTHLPGQQNPFEEAVQKSSLSDWDTSALTFTKEVLAVFPCTNKVIFSIITLWNSVFKC
jgi:hypothetical protein